MTTRRSAMVTAWLAAALAVASLSTGADTYVPPFDLPMLGGGTASEQDLTGDVVLVFLVPDCSACETVIDRVVGVRAQYPGIRFLVVTAAPSDALEQELATKELSVPVIVDSYGLLASLCLVRTVPAVCAFSSTRLVNRLDWVFSDEDLRKCLDALVAGVAVAWPWGADLLRGQAAPAFPLRDKAGETAISQDSLAPSLIAFVMEDCPYCQSMLPALLRCCESLAVRLVVVGTEDAGAFSALASERLEVLPDPEREIADLYHVSSVPTFFLIDSHGKVEWLHEGVMEGLWSICEAALRRNQ